MENIFVEFLPPWVETGIQPAFYDKESGSVLQQTARMYARVNMLIRMFNKLSKETRESFTELYNYVHDFFDNLDVQEEINNKLDKMVEDGTFDILLGEYIYDEITVNEYFNEDRNTKYWVTHVPHLDSRGNMIKLKHGLADDIVSTDLSATETPRSFAKRSASTLCVNASIFQNTDPEKSNYMHPIGPIIKDGVLICNYGKEGAFSTTPNYILGVKDDNTLKVYDFETTPEELIADGVVNTIVAFDQLMEDGVITSDYSDTYYYKWNIIGQNSETKDIYFFECEGSNIFGAEGMSIPQGCQILKDLGCDFAYRLDQGGSTSLNKNGIQLNQPSDDKGTTERKVPDYIYFGKELITSFDKAVYQANCQLSDTSMESMVNKANHAYMQNIKTAQIDVEETGVVAPLSRKGMHLNYKENGTIDSSIVLSGTGRPKQLTVYDNENAKTIAIIDGVNGKLQAGEGDSVNNRTISIVGEPDGVSNVQVAHKTLVFDDSKLNLYDNATNTTKLSIDSSDNSVNFGTNKLSFSGNELVYKIGDTNKVRLNSQYKFISFGGSEDLRFNDHQINLYDGSTKIRLDSTTGKVTLGSKLSPDIYEKIDTLPDTTDFNSLNKTGFYFIQYTSGQSNAPFDVACYVINLTPATNSVMQIAVANTSDASYKPKFRLNIGGTWTAWATFA